jgi:hypothetical protein
VPHRVHVSVPGRARCSRTSSTATTPTASRRCS